MRKESEVSLKEASCIVKKITTVTPNFDRTSKSNTHLTKLQSKMEENGVVWLY